MGLFFFFPLSKMLIFFSYFYTKTYTLGTHLKRLNDENSRRGVVKEECLMIIIIETLFSSSP